MADRPKKFIKGHNALKGKAVASSKQLSKAKELERKKAEEAETAAVLNEYIADFQTGAAGGKTFVRAGVYHPEKSQNKPFLPGQDDDQVESSKLYKPKSKMQELAEEFKKSKVITEEYKSSKDIKKKSSEKKKSNLELFKEELEQSQKERDIRQKLKKGDLSGISEEVLHSLPPSFFKPKSTEDEFGYQYENVGSHDTGDPSTTNLFISNINPKMNEEQLCKVFGRYGPLASVKIMWPRTEEEKARNRNCGFVAFMNRKDGEKALADIEGKYVMDYEMKIGWGKTVPIPPQPIYVHPSQSHAVKPPKQSGLPFNCHLTNKMKKTNHTFDGNLENTVVKVVIPNERNILSLINRVVEFVVREGPMFEAMIMNREIANPMFRFLFDNKSNEHIYYRWRVFSLLQGDTTSKWSQSCFRMFVGGSIWQPPLLNPYNTISAGMSASAAIACASSANVHNPGNSASVRSDASSPTLAMKKNYLLEQLLKESSDADEKEAEKEKKTLSDRQRDKLEDMLRIVTTDRAKIGELMMWCIDHAEYSEEVVECVCESLSIPETPITTKIARLFVVSDILHNAGAKVHNASSFRKAFQNNLLESMDHMHKALSTCRTKAQTEKFRKQVLSCLAAWQDWSVYPPGFLIQLQNIFVGIETSKNIKMEEEFANNENLLAKLGAQGETDLFADDIDGVPFGGAINDDVDGIAMLDEDIDGVPLSRENLSSVSNKNKLTSDDPLSKSRWEKTSDDDDMDGKEKEPIAGKWEKVEGVKKGKNSKPDEEDGKLDSKKVMSPKRREMAGEDDEERRRFLRDVELKVMRFVDKLEQRGASRSGLNIQKEGEKFRQQLIEEYEKTRASEHKKRGKSERKRDRSRSASAGESKRRKGSKKRASSMSNSDSENEWEPRKRNVDRSPRYSPLRSGSPKNSARSPIFSDRSRSPFNYRHQRSPSLSPSRRSISPDGRSPRYGRSPSPSFSPKRLSSSVNKSRKKKSKKERKR